MQLTEAECVLDRGRKTPQHFRCLLLASAPPGAVEDHVAGLP